MNTTRFFDIVNRINSLAILLLLIVGLIFSVMGLVSLLSWNTREEVKVVTDDSPAQAEKVVFEMGNMVSVAPGTKYITLYTKGSGGKFSSGGSRKDVYRNVMFLNTRTLDQKWLYPDNDNLIEDIDQLKKPGERYDGKTIAILYKVLRKDTNKDGYIGTGDLETIALTDEEGNRYSEIELGVQSVLDSEVIDDGKFLLLMVKKNDEKWLMKYSLSSFKRVQESVLSENKS